MLDPDKSTVENHAPMAMAAMVTNHGGQPVEVIDRGESFATFGEALRRANPALHQEIMGGALDCLGVPARLAAFDRLAEPI